MSQRENKLLGFSLVPWTMTFFCEQLVKKAQEDKHSLISYLNAAQINLAFESPSFAQKLQQMDILYADGASVVWATNHAGGSLPERVSAADFLPELARTIAKSGNSLALIGGKPGIEGSKKTSEAETTAQLMKKWAPTLKIAFTHHGYVDTDSSLSKHVQNLLKQHNPSIVLLGMGAPLQEKWAIQWSQEGKPKVWWCVGALFEYFSGTRPRAPRWMRQTGLEWSFRLSQEPGRLWRRYLLGNPLFIWRVWKKEPPHSS